MKINKANKKNKMKLNHNKPITKKEVNEFVKDSTNQELDLTNQISVTSSMLHHKINPLNYWKNDELYDDKLPIQDAVSVLLKHQDKFDIVFVSNCFSEHIDSKKRFINRWFGDFPFIDTHHKEYIQCDVVIDDRAYYLRQIQSRQPDAKCIQIKTEINNYHEEYDYMNWDEIDDFLDNFK